jgi:uncharacterized protein (DUF1501 family)
MKDLFHSRRHFLQATGAVAVAAPVATAFGLQLAAFSSAVSQSASSGYKAVVCIFQLGGNDSNNSVLASDTDSWNRYWAARNTGSDPIALMPVGTAPVPIGATSALTGKVSALNRPEAWGGILPIVPKTTQAVPSGTNATARTFGLHPMLGPLASLYSQGRLAVVANIGSLIEPITKAQFQANSKRKPVNLFSHNDQQAVWQSGLTEGVRKGWGGQFGDLLASGNGANSLYTAMSTAGNAVFLAGQSVIQYQVSTGATPAVRINSAVGTTLFGSAVAPAKLTEVIQDTGFVANMGSDYAGVVRRSMGAATALNAASASAMVTAIPPPPTYTNPINCRL